MFSRSPIRIVALFVTASLLIASDCSSTPEPPCVPGDTQDCECGGGYYGVQSCNSGGTGWGACLRCPGPTPTPDAGPPPMSMCRPSGVPVLNCGCNGPAIFGTTFSTSGCCSGGAVRTQCAGFCSEGGYPWASICL